MALIASGWRQVHLDSDKNQYVMFDDGIYRLNDKVEIDHSDGEDWVFCASHMDDNDEIAHAVIGGVMMPLAGPSAEGFEYGKVDDEEVETD